MLADEGLIVYSQRLYRTISNLCSQKCSTKANKNERKTAKNERFLNSCLSKYE